MKLILFFLCLTSATFTYGGNINLNFENLNLPKLNSSNPNPSYHLKSDDINIINYVNNKNNNRKIESKFKENISHEDLSSSPIPDYVIYVNRIDKIAESHF